MSASSVDLYNNIYGDFASSAEAAVRREAFGEDIGQSSWITATEWLSFADRLRLGPSSEVLEVGSGSGGPAVYLAQKRGCRLTGIDINEHGVRNGTELAEACGVADLVQFRAVDANQTLPFDAGRFDTVVSTDAITHIRSRSAAFREWYRVLRSGGRVLFTDGLVLTGAVSNEELAVRSSIGFFLFLPPGENERLLLQAGFAVLRVEDVTQNAANVARRWHDARARHRGPLVAREGEANFEGLQRFLRCVHVVSAEHRLSRYAYLAEKP